MSNFSKLIEQRVQNGQILRYYKARTMQIGGNYKIFHHALVALWGNYKVFGQNVITSYFRICSVRHYKAYWTIDFSQYNTWIFLFLFSNKVLDPIWKVYGLGFSKKSLDCENSWFSKTGILKFLLPLPSNKNENVLVLFLD